MNTILVCTNNLVPKRLLEQVLANALAVARAQGDTNVVVVSHFPVFFSHTPVNIEVEEERHISLDDALIKEPFVNPDAFLAEGINIVVGERRYDYTTILRQMEVGLKYCGDNVIIMEHDVMYPHDYLETMIESLEKGYDFVVWGKHCFLTFSGYIPGPNYILLSQYSGTKEAWSKYVSDSLKQMPSVFEPPIYASDGSILDGCLKLIDVPPVLDVKHGFNTTGNISSDTFEDWHEYWGPFDKMQTLCGMDDQWGDIASNHPECGYGLVL